MVRRFSAGLETIASKVEPWADTPPTGGTAMDASGDFYFSDLATNSIKRRMPDRKITTLVQDKRHWVDALEIDDQRRLWLPVPQLDRAAIFHRGKSQIEWPIMLFRVQLPGSS